MKVEEIMKVGKITQLIKGYHYGKTHPFFDDAMKWREFVRWWKKNKLLLESYAVIIDDKIKELEK